MDEGHNANDDTDEAGQQRQDHEGAGGVEVSCGQGQRSVTGGVSTSRQRGIDLRCNTRQLGRVNKQI